MAEGDHSGIYWKDLKPAKGHRSSVLETSDAEVGDTLSLPAFGILTLRCEEGIDSTMPMQMSDTWYLTSAGMSPPI